MKEFYPSRPYECDYEYLHPGYYGPIYVNQVWSEEETAGDYADKYWETDYCSVFRPRRMFKAEIECENPEILNSVLRQIANMDTCPFDDPVKSIADKANEEITSVINAKIVENMISENLDYIVKEIRLEAEKYKRYKLKHKILYRC